MKVRDVMKTDVGFCSTEDSLRKTAETMRYRDCGAVPIVDEEKKVIGVLTDRDICLAIAARNRQASDVKNKELIGGKVFVCVADDKIEDALRKMRKHQIKRLPVVDADNRLTGILALSDVLLAAGKNKDLKKKIYAALKAIYQPPPIVLREISADHKTDTTKSA